METKPYLNSVPMLVAAVVAFCLWLPNSRSASFVVGGGCTHSKEYNPEDCPPLPGQVCEDKYFVCGDAGDDVTCENAVQGPACTSLPCAMGPKHAKNTLGCGDGHGQPGS